MTKPKIHLVAAARPNFMKAAPLWHALARDNSFDVKLIHTGQHYDESMSGAFFRELKLPSPHYNLDVGSGRHGKQTAAVLERYETLCLESDLPDWTIVIGDVNSTAGCALAAAKVGVKVAHLEAGLRSFDRAMPEEINRLVTDALSDILWTPSPDADENLAREGVTPEKILRVGNIMIDSYELQKNEIAKASSARRLSLAPGKYGVVTLHRPSNVDSAACLQDITDKLARLTQNLALVWPLHPRARARLAEFGLFESVAGKIKIIDPLSYIPFMSLVKDSALVLTDSGGVQEETTYLGIPCLTLRQNTERPVTISEGTNKLVSAATVLAEAERVLAGGFKRKGPPALWDGKAAFRIVEHLKNITGVSRAPVKKAVG